MEDDGEPDTEGVWLVVEATVDGGVPEAETDDVPDAVDVGVVDRVTDALLVPDCEIMGRGNTKEKV